MRLRFMIISFRSKFKLMIWIHPKFQLTKICLKISMKKCLQHFFFITKAKFISNLSAGTIITAAIYYNMLVCFYQVIKLKRS